ncbi:MAG: hypothetical protein QW597_06505 [Thermoplasmataceae archaeon]
MLDELSNYLMEEAWRYRSRPEMMLKKCHEALKNYNGNPVELFEYANALNFLGRNSEEILLYRKALILGFLGINGFWGKSEDYPTTVIFLCIALFRSG